MIVEASTGVTYGEQCMGLACDQREVEGFLIPTFTDAERLVAFFARFHGWPPGIQEKWKAADVEELAALVAGLRVWRTYSNTEDRNDEPHFLVLDRERLAESTEAWVRVLTPYGPGVLIFPNSD
ncbi:DUF6210 family protein [Deinococcus planocerae]|uniref:DUF6210 family protein n=1 Tax=Deinococcus planocerae TaxID=1737569 RepID=UPI001FE88185|nr:DUF6210 family protein [Deinococcus planocerae]